MIKEACVETLQEAINAEKKGANRIELCAELHLDGTTPDYNLVKSVCEAINIPVKVMIRPRGGSFVYTEQEVLEMEESIKLLSELNIFGVVYGALTTNNIIDIDVIKRLRKCSKSLNVTFHKAIDDVPNPLEAINLMLEHDVVDAILTSGTQKTAAEGVDMLCKMVSLCGDNITIIAAGRVTKENLQNLHSIIQTTEYHGRRIV